MNIDYTLLEKIKNNDQDAFDLLVNKFSPIIYSKAYRYKKSYRFVEIDDLYQAGLIGLYNSVKGYNKDSGNPFEPFAVICIKREMFAYIKKLRRAYYDDDGNAIIEMDKVIVDDNLTLLDMVASNKDSVEQYVNKKIVLEKTIELLSTNEIEYKITLLHGYGYSYKEIAAITGLSVKKVDNILQRIRKKIAYLFD